MDLKSSILQKKMLIITGTGGVGKTTLSAAIAIQAAKMGKKTIVLTIDPAKRLANALGLRQFSHQEKVVSVRNHAKLTVMMLDTKDTCDELIKKYAPSLKIAEKILSNQLYIHLSTMLAGTQDYMALEKLYKLNESKNYDLIVLDTPPAKHSLRFLEAPDRLAKFLDENILKWFLKPHFFSGNLGVKIFAKLVKRLTGIELLYDLSEFFLNLETLAGGFRERTLKAKAILQSKEAQFFLVANPQKVVFDRTIQFHRQLSSFHLPFGGIMINRIAREIPLSEREKKELLQLKKKISPDEQPLLTFEAFLDLARREREQITLFKKAIPPSVPIWEIPSFEEDIYDIKGLNLINLHLFQ